MIEENIESRASAVRAANQQRYPFSICAQSVAMLMWHTRWKDWCAQLASRQVLSKTTTTKLVRLMMDCRPSAAFDTMEGVSVHVFDQCYKKKGKPRGKHRAAERVDASGDLVDLISMVIVNSVTISVPASLGGGISAGQLASLKRTGPYTKPFDTVLPCLHPDRVKRSLTSMLKETMTWVEQVADRFELDDIADMTLGGMARALVGRPNISGGKTPMHINKPILHCDTKSHLDGIKIIKFLESCSTGEREAILAAYSDGQSMVT